MAQFNLNNYEEVKDRIPKFYDKYPDGRIITALKSSTDALDMVVFKAYVYASAEEQLSDTPLATGWAMEVAGEGMVNKTSHLENCETSAIGRALANIGLHGDKRPSREEMAKVERGVGVAPRERTASLSESDVLEKKRKQFFAAAHSAGVSSDKAKATIKKTYGLESFNEATIEELTGAIEVLNEMAATNQEGEKE
jgi:hypothetical protein